MRASYKSFCQQEVKRDGPYAAKVEEARVTAEADTYIGYVPQRHAHKYQ